MWLHHRMGLIRCCVGRVKLNRRCQEGGSEVTDRGIRRTTGHTMRLCLGHRFCEVKRTFCPDVVDLDKTGGGACLFKGLAHNDRDGLVVMFDLRTTEQLSSVEFALVEPAGTIRGDDGEHTSGRLRGTEIHRRDPTLCDCGTDYVPIGRLRRHVVAFIGIRRRTAYLETAVDPI